MGGFGEKNSRYEKTFSFTAVGANSGRCTVVHSLFISDVLIVVVVAWVLIAAYEATCVPVE